MKHVCCIRFMQAYFTSSTNNAPALLLAAACAETSQSHLVGGNSISLKKIVDMFYDKVLADTDLFPFFESIDMSKLKKHQVRH